MEELALWFHEAAEALDYLHDKGRCTATSSRTTSSFWKGTSGWRISAWPACRTRR